MDQCTYEWQTIAFRQPDDAKSGSVVLAFRTDHGRPLAPDATASWDDWGPPAPGSGRSEKKTADANRLIIKDRTGRVIQTYVWPVEGFDRRVARMKHSTDQAGPATSEDQQDDRDPCLSLAAGKSFSLVNGPRIVAMGPRPESAHTQGQPPAPAPATAPAVNSKLYSFSYRRTRYSQGESVWESSHLRAGFYPGRSTLETAGAGCRAFPAAGVSFLHAIPAIGNKFGGPQTMAPMGQPAVAEGEYRGQISLYFGHLPH